MKITLSALKKAGAVTAILAGFSPAVPAWANSDQDREAIIKSSLCDATADAASVAARRRDAGYSLNDELSMIAAAYPNDHVRDGVSNKDLRTSAIQMVKEIWSHPAMSPVQAYVKYRDECRWNILHTGKFTSPSR